MAMAKSKKKQPDTLKPEKNSDEPALLDQVVKQQTESSDWLQPMRDTWPDKESMLIGKTNDSLSKGTGQNVSDPRLATIQFERTARVMAQNPSGKAFAVSENDIGKNMIMNMLLEWYMKHANEQHSMLLKYKLLDLYSGVYGAMFALAPWRINTDTNYIGPEMLIIPIRDVFPQVGKPNVNDMDIFTVRNWVSIDWLVDQAKAYPDHWKSANIQALAADIKVKKDVGDGADKKKDNKNQTYIEQNWFPSNSGDSMFPQVEIFTSYMRDKWITWSSRVTSEGKPYILRVVMNPYVKGLLPIIDKQCFPLLESPIGLGEFERGQTLQFAMNSLISLYMKGVKYNAFPPSMINPKNVVPSSIRWKEGARWFMKNPGEDVKPYRSGTEWLQTFQSTYGFLLSAIMDQAGTTTETQSTSVKSSLGKTPAALKLQFAAQNSRDKWDQMMMEEMINKQYERWIAMIADPEHSKLVKAQTVRIYGTELEQIKQQYPDATKIFESGTRGNIDVTKEMVASEYDYEQEAGSILAPDLNSEDNAISDVLQAVGQNPNIVKLMAMEVDEKGAPQPTALRYSELFKRHLRNNGMKDADKLVVKLQQPEAPAAAASPAAGAVPPQPQATMPPGAAPMADPNAPAPQALVSQGDYSDAEIQAAAAQLLGGTQGIPAAQPVPA